MDTAQVSDQAVARWLRNAVFTNQHVYVTDGHRGHVPAGDYSNAAFGVNYTGYCPACADSEAVIYFDARCSCDGTVKLRVQIGSWQDTYRKLYELAWDIHSFEEDNGEPDTDFWHPLAD